MILGFLNFACKTVKKRAATAAAATIRQFNTFCGAAKVTFFVIDSCKEALVSRGSVNSKFKS